MNEKELWKEIHGYKGKYKISNLGRVKSYYRNPPLIKAARYARINSRYKYIKLGTDNKYVHRLVAEAFCFKKPHHTQVNHINGNPEDNRACNLEWCTPSENIVHSLNILSNGGENHGRAKLSDIQVKEIRESRLPQKELALKYGVSKSHISRIKLNLRRRNQKIN